MPRRKLSKDQWPDHKVCSKCNIDKSLEFFNDKPRGLYDKNARCKQCIDAYIQTWRESNPEYDRIRDESRKEARKEEDRNRRLANIEVFLERERARYRNNPEKEKLRHRKYIQNNPAINAASSHRRRARINKCDGTYTAQEFTNLCDQYGNICLCCKKSDIKLTVDHVIPISLGGSNSIENIQPLCGSCNSAKGIKTTDYR